MKKLDRLSALIHRFELSVTPSSTQKANLVIYYDDASDAPTRIAFAPLGTVTAQPSAYDKVLFAAVADWGGATNPFLSALPAQIDLMVKDDPELIHIATFLQIETSARRCGAGAVLDRLGEVLLIRILRSTIETGGTDVGLLSGLADPRLSRAIVAMHEDPGRKWRGSDLADIAGLSQSRFSELFHTKVGEPPASYLRRWRMVLARQDVERGDRIQSIAHRYGYGSAEALSRAFKRAHNLPAIALRHAR